MTGFKDQIKKDMIAAMRAKNSASLTVIRMLQAAIKQKEIDERITLDDTAILGVIEKMVKQRRESIKQFEQGNRPDLVAKESNEIEVLLTYLPKQLTEAEVCTLVKNAISTTQASGMQDMGKVMGLLKPQVQGRANLSTVSALIKAQLSK